MSAINLRSHTEPLAPLAYTIRQAQQLLPLSHTKFYEMIASGELRSVKVGGRRLVLAASIRKLLDE